MFKKILSLVLAAMMLCALSVTAFAESATLEDNNDENVTNIIALSSGDLPAQKIYLDISWDRDALEYNFGYWDFDAMNTGTYTYLNRGWINRGNVTFVLKNNSNCKVNVSGEVSTEEGKSLPDGVTATMSAGKTLKTVGSFGQTGNLTLTVAGDLDEVMTDTVNLTVKIKVAPADDDIYLPTSGLSPNMLTK